MIKFRKNWIGPYEIIEKNENNVIYNIKPVKRNGRSKWVHQNKLKTFFANGRTAENVKQEPVEIELEVKQKEAEEGQLECADANGILEDEENNVEANRSVRKDHSALLCIFGPQNILRYITPIYFTKYLNCREFYPLLNPCNNLSQFTFKFLCRTLWRFENTVF